MARGSLGRGAGRAPRSRSSRQGRFAGVMSDCAAMPRDHNPSFQRALLPLRFFVGGTFLFAGIDKLLDPAFLRVAGPGSIGEQLATYSRISPLAPLVQAIALPAPLLVGVLIASLEIVAGLGALTGLAYRACAI